MSFEGDIIKFTNRSVKEVDRIRRGVIIDLFSAVINDTPADTGLLRGNWQTSVGKPKNSKLSREDKTGSAAKAKIANNLGKFGDAVHMTNNLAYAKVAEYGGWNGPTEKVTSDGFSRKASKGMVRKNALRIKKRIRKLAAQAK